MWPPVGGPHDMFLARRFLVSGRVQRVGFRAFVAGTARREGIRGFVRNLTDGRVEAVGEGERAAIERFVRALHEGPPLARVMDVIVEELAPLNLTGEFTVRAR